MDILREFLAAMLLIVLLYALFSEVCITTTQDGVSTQVCYGIDSPPEAYDD